jgi:hypothetical protein
MQKYQNIIKAQDVDIINSNNDNHQSPKTSNGNGNSIKAASHFRLQGG